MNKSILKITVLFFLFVQQLFSQANFLKQQLKYTHVAEAQKEKWAAISKNLKAKNIDITNYKILIRIFKEEKLLEVWLKSKTNTTYIHYEDYPICRSSGVLGPKRTEGDYQVPEGVYTVNFFNAFSDYYLGMQVNYPNASDKILGKKPFGGQIMIHGNCVTIGCIPITDDKIKEVYLLCLYSKGAGNELAIHSFPFKLTDKKVEAVKNQYDKKLINFWTNLKPIYTFFEEKKQLPIIAVDVTGNYKIKS
ncbi:MAG: L,D-transpeptidase family protein [Bacteroidia bacterium]